MRETIKDWKDEWIETNGLTDDLEVVIKDCALPELHSYIYEGSFRNIPEELEVKKVIDWAKIVESSIPDRIGAYSLSI